MCPTLAGVLSCALRERGDRQCCLCYSKSIWYFHMRSSYIQISPMEHGGSPSCLTDQRLKGGNDRSSLGSVLIGLSWSFKFCVLKHMPYTRLVPRGLNAELLLFHTAPLLLRATASYQNLLPGRPSTIGRARALSHALEQVVGKWCTLHLNPLLHFCGFRICFFFNFSSGTNTCKIITPKIIVKYS